MRRKIRLLVSTALVAFLFIVFLGYHWILSPNTDIDGSYELFIPAGHTFKEVRDQLVADNVIKGKVSFDVVAKLMKYQGNVPSGRYLLQDGWSNKQLISKLRSGQQDPVMVTISTARNMQDIASIVSKQIEADSSSIMHTWSDTLSLRQLGFDRRTAIAMIIPNSYEMYWNVKQPEFLRRMKREYDRFWEQKDRLPKAERLGMTPVEVSTLASIVEKETIQESEKPTIAGVYLNRLERGILLQADPTVVFAVGDFEIRRVLNKHLSIDSPYNTYKYAGLPPGPICMPSITSIDAVLNAEDHDYLFFCAKPGYNGEHAFAKTNRQHERNAAIYRRWLNEENIKS